MGWTILDRLSLFPHPSYRRYRITFENGYGASVIREDWLDGLYGPETYECAVLYDDTSGKPRMICSSEITKLLEMDDDDGCIYHGLSRDELEQLLHKIEALPKANQ